MALCMPTFGKAIILHRLTPKTGAVLAWLNLNGLLESQGPRPNGADVLNGIADAGNGHLYVTGKRWPYLFEIEILKSVKEKR